MAVFNVNDRAFCRTDLHVGLLHYRRCEAVNLPIRLEPAGLPLSETTRIDWRAL